MMIRWFPVGRWDCIVETRACRVGDKGRRMDRHYPTDHTLDREYVLFSGAVRENSFEREALIGL